MSPPPLGTQAVPPQSDFRVRTANTRGQASPGGWKVTRGWEASSVLCLCRAHAPAARLSRHLARRPAETEAGGSPSL